MGSIKVLFLGDIVGTPGCQFVRDKLPNFRRQQGIDIVIANGENSAEGNGILPASAQHLRDSGVDIITGGNHSLRRREIYEELDTADDILRPANLHPQAPGKGYTVYDGLKFRLAVINLQGNVYMDAYQNPFACIDQLLQTIDTPNIILDFHAEATSEKLCMTYYLEGKVSAVLGTHTHVQTADARILPSGTAAITDAGMCGGIASVLGVKADLALKRLRTNLPVRFENDDGPQKMSGVLLQIDSSTGKTKEITPINLV